MRNALLGLAVMVLAAALSGCGGDTTNGPANAKPDPAAANAALQGMPKVPAAKK